jgi:ribonuclease P protein component
MIGRAGHITKFNQKEVDQLFKKSHRIFYGTEFTVLAAPREKEYARLLIITPKNIGNAVRRHLLRRRLKHIFYQLKFFDRLKYDVVVIAKKPVTALDFQPLHDLFLKAVSTIL